MRTLLLLLDTASLSLGRLSLRHIVGFGFGGSGLLVSDCCWSRRFDARHNESEQEQL